MSKDKVVHISKSDQRSTTRVRRGRELAGLTMGQASRLLGITLTSLSDLEMGRSTPNERELELLADCYGCSLAWLAGLREAQVSDATKDVLRSANITSDEREDLIELLGSIQTGRGES